MCCIGCVRIKRYIAKEQGQERVEILRVSGSDIS